MNIRRTIAQAIADSLDEQDQLEPSPLNDTMTWNYIDQRDVDFGKIADKVIERLGLKP